MRQFLPSFLKWALLKDSARLMGGFLGILELHLPDRGGIDHLSIRPEVV